MRGIHRIKKGQSPYDGKQALGYRIQGSFIAGYGGHVAPPFERFFLGGDTDIRGFDVRSISPVAFFTEVVNTQLISPQDPCAQNPGVACTGVPLDPNNPRRGNYLIPIPVRQIIFPGGDTSIIGNLEYRIPIAGPVTLAPFVDFGMNMILLNSQLKINDDQFRALNTSAFGCPATDPVTFACVGGQSQAFNQELQIVPGTNYVPRMSTGIELQVIMPIVNAPFRIYYAWNPLRMNTTTLTPSTINRQMFPVNGINAGAGDYSFQQTLSTFAPSYTLREPANTFRFTVSTTF
jgi:outer membrane protein insertion porin family